MNMKKFYEKILAMYLVLTVFIVNCIPVYANGFDGLFSQEHRCNNVRNYERLSNSEVLGVADINKQIKDIFPKGEIVAIKETSYGTAYYVDRYYHNQYKPKLLWDALDIVMAGSSWAKFFGEPSLANLGWATLDTVALLPGLPSSAYIRKGGKLLLNVDEVKKLAKTSEGLKIIRNALKTPKVSEKTSELVRIFNLAKNYTLSNSVFNHILTEHAYNSIKPKSKFKKGFDIKSGIKEVLTTESSLKNNTKTRDGYIFVKDFGKVIGYDGNKELTKLKVVLSEKGAIITAFPIK